MKVWQHWLFFPFLILVCPLVIYLAFVVTSPLYVKATQYNYFSYLADALLHRSIAFVNQPTETLDLVPFKGKLYLFAPPSPALIALPFVWRFGLDVPDALYTAFIGAINPLLVYMTVLAFARLVKTPLRRADAFLLALFYAFGTTHFYEAVSGGVWHTGQIISQTYLLGLLLCLFRYLLSRNRLLLIGVGTFTFLTILGRNQLILAIPSLLTISYFVGKRSWKAVAIALVSGTTAALAINSLYNFVRFGSLFEDGFKMHNYNDFFAPFIRAHGLFSSAFIPVNIWYHFLNPLLFAPHWPYLFAPNYMGNSIFLTSPLLLLLFLLPLRWEQFRNRRIIALLLLASFLVYIPALLQFSTGWRQFGARYLLDVMPFFILILVIIQPRLTKPAPLILIFASIYIQCHAFLLFRY